MDTVTLAEPNGNYLESVQASSVLACASEMFFFLSFSVTRAAQWNYSLLYSHSFLLFMCNTNSTPLCTTHASSDTSLSVPRALKSFPLVSSYLPSLDGSDKESIMTLLSSVFGGLAILYEVIPKLQGFFTRAGC